MVKYGKNNPKPKTNTTYKGVTVINPGTLSRSVSKAARGITPGVGTPEANYQLKIVRLNQSLYSGNITPQQYAAQTGQAAAKRDTAQYERTIEFGRVAAVQGKSDRVKQREARGIAATKGVAIGTVSKDDTSQVSQSSKVNSVQVSEFVEAQKTQAKTQEPQPIQGPVKPNYAYSVEFTEGGKKNTILPGGSLEYLYGQPPKVYDTKRYDNLGEATKAGFGNALRYSDAVDSGELPQPKGLEYLNYYASRGLRPLYNIPLSLLGDKNIQPTLGSTLIDVPIDLVTKGKTPTHDPIGDFIKKDPLATVTELPAEAALWAVGAKAIETGVKITSRYSPLLYQSKKIATGSTKPETIYRGITFKDKPVIGIQNRKVKIGYDEAKVATAFSKVETKSLGRDGMEVALGSGIEKELIFSQRTLGELVSAKIIPKIAKERALAVKQGVVMARGIQNKIGAFGKEPIEGLTQKQSDFLLTKVVKGQKAKDIDTIHGSAALKPQLGDEIVKQAGSSVKLGDLDVIPKGKNLPKTADKLIQGFAQDFPLEPGQRLSIKYLGGGQTTNRALELSGGKLKEPKKILEVVLKSTDDSKYGIPPGKKVIGERIPFNKSVKDTEFGVKLHTADYQLLTNVKQVLSFQKGSNTLLDIFPSSGRTKDIVRTYWNLKAKALFKSDKELNTQADYIRSLYKNVEFTDYKPEKVLLYSSRTTSQSTKPISIPARPITPRETRQESSVKWNLPKSSRVISSRIRSSRLNSRVQSRIQTRPTTSLISVKSGSNTSRLIGSKKPTSTNQSKRPSRINPPSKTPTSLTPSTILTTPSTKTPPPKLPGKPIGRPLSIVPRSKSIYRIPANLKLGGLILIKMNNTTKKTIGTKKPSHNFLGNTRTSEITGFRTKKTTIDVGDKRTRKLYNEDILKSKRSYKKKMKNPFGTKSKVSLRL